MKEKMLIVSWSSLDESVREDVELIKNDPQFGGKAPDVVGVVYEIENGTLRLVE